jgi:lipoprotein-releasing system permease protein
LNFEFFIANRLLKNETAARKISRPVIRISIWAIAIGIVIMIVAVATGNGLRKEIRNKITGFGGHIQIVNYQPNPTYEQTPVELGDSLLELITNRAEVERIQAFSRKAGIMKAGDDFEGLVLKGVGPDYQWENLSDYLVEGNRLRLNDSTYNDSVVISQNTANRLSLSINDKVNMYFVRDPSRPPLLRKFYIAGIYRTDLEEIDNSIIVGDIKHTQRLNRWEENQVGGYEVFLSDEEKSLQEAGSIRVLLPFDAEALTARQLNEQLFQWLDLFDVNIILIIIIMIVVATINMSIALLILILERTQMIGILKALGTNNLSIQRIFLINAGYLIGRGLLWGNAIGIGLCLLQQHFKFIKLDPATYYVSAVSIDLNLIYILGLNLVTMIICVLCLIIPSFLISRISPVKAIRFD